MNRLIKKVFELEEIEKRLELLEIGIAELKIKMLNGDFDTADKREEAFDLQRRFDEIVAEYQDVLADLNQ